MKSVHIPKLTRRLDEEAARWAARKVTPTLIASEATGRPYTVDAFGHVFRQVCAAAAEEGPEMSRLWFMSLRHTTVLRLTEAGVSIPQIAPITEHTLATCHSILERYNVRTDKMAISAFRQRLEA